MNTTLPKSTRRHVNWTNLYLEPHDYWIYCVNIGLRHQYGISEADSQTFLLAIRPRRRRAGRKACFRRLNHQNLEHASKWPSTFMHPSHQPIQTIMYKYFVDALDRNNDPENPRSWKTICPSCNVSRNLSIRPHCHTKFYCFLHIF